MIITLIGLPFELKLKTVVEERCQLLNKRFGLKFDGQCSQTAASTLLVVFYYYYYYYY